MGIVSYIKEEIRVVRERDPAIKSNMEVLLYPSFRVILRYRVAHKLYLKKHYFWARWISQRAARKTGIEIHPGAKIGRGLFIDHGSGVIIGETTVIGDNVTLYQGVTLGGTGKEQGKRHPTLEDNVMVSAGAKILGSFTIGENSKIGAGSVVLEEVPPNCTVVGVPGRIVTIQGASRFPVRKDTTLKSLLQYVEIEPAIADTSAIYIRRQSVAAQQKAIIADSLRRLEQSALTSTSSSVDEANIRVREAELIQDFVRRAATLEPDGVVVVSRGGTVKDLLLEDNDVIVIPQKTDVVHVSGEVLIPKAITYEKGMSLHEYLESAGGLSDRADKDNILVAKQNGEVGKVQNMGIAPGDRILVMPRFDSKNMQLAKDFTQILYQIAVATKVAVGL